MTVRTRFAPSPTGSLHIGGVRTALFNFLYARREKGLFLIRIEDTDRDRSRKEFEDEILDSLRWLGLNWDEDVRRQSDRVKLYEEALAQLMRAGHAYEVEEKGRVAIKVKMPHRAFKFNDLVHGAIDFDGSKLGDFVIRKSDGFPTYHLASVVDDHEMGITHVIRGDDHVSNTPRHLLLYELLGWKPPRFAHLPLVAGQDRTPLSKRHGAVSLSYFREQGFLPEALLNYLALLGWSPGGDRELLSRDQLTQEFQLERVHKTSACFDVEKLRWLNSEHLRLISHESYVAEALKWLPQQKQDFERNAKIALLCKERISTFQDLKSLTSYFFTDEISFDAAAVRKHFSSEETCRHLATWEQVLTQEGDFSSAEALESLLRRTAERLGIAAKRLIHPTRVAVSGRSVTPSLFDVLILLGKDRVIKRIRYVTIHFQMVSQLGKSDKN
jgi:glutamyl-tRNA synthetase